MTAHRRTPPTADSPDTEAWHSLPADEVVRLTDSRPEGLGSAEARQRLDIHGPNQLEDEPPPHPVFVLLRQFRSPLIYILLAATAVYWNSLDNGFVYDDLVTVEENLFIRDWRNLGKFFSADYYVRSEEYSFRPLVTLTYFADWALFKRNPRGYHLTNLLLHLLAGLAVFGLGKKICSSPGIGFLAALIFLVHPAQAEAVNAISVREELLC